MTLETISDNELKVSYVYPPLIELLVMQGNLPSARQIVAGLKEEWLTGGRRITKALQELAEASVKTEDVQGTVTWANQLKGPYAKAYASLGVAEALMDLKGIEDIGGLLSHTHVRETCLLTRDH